MAVAVAVALEVVPRVGARQLIVAGARIVLCEMHPCAVPVLAVPLAVAVAPAAAMALVVAVALTGSAPPVEVLLIVASRPVLDASDLRPAPAGLIAQRTLIRARV